MRSYENYIVLDVETNGLYPENGARVISITALKVLDGIIADKYFSLLKSDALIQNDVAELTGISNKLLKSAPIGSIVLPSILSFISGLPTISHNAEFVEKFLEKELRDLNLDGFLEYNCTLEAARNLFPGQKCSIDALMKKLELKETQNDDVINSDVHNVFQIYECFKNNF